MNTKDQLKEKIENGIPCYYRYGYAYKGAGKRKITKEEALELLPKYSFGMGFYEILDYTNDSSPYIVFNEYSENDLL